MTSTTPPPSGAEPQPGPGPAPDLVAGLLERFSTSEATIGVVGLGYVGLPLCNAFLRAGTRVLGVDIDPVKIEKLERAEPYLQYVDADMPARLAASERFGATTDFLQLRDADAILICVPTPLGPHREPNLDYVEQTCADLGKALRPGQLVVLVSTTYPRTTRDVVLPALRRAAPTLTPGVDYFVAYSPEREDPGNVDFTTQSTPRLVGGMDAPSGDLAKALFELAVADVHLVSSAEVAEASKILENTFRAVNIALVNELKVLLLEMGIDIFEVVRAAATKPFGYMPFYPGPGLGGHCIPIDPFYLSWKAREFGVATKFVELAGEVNSSMPSFVVQRVTDALNDHSQSVRGARILMLGLAYKRDVDDVRESPAFEIGAALLQRGAELVYADPHVESGERERSPSLDVARVEVTRETIEQQDLVLLLVDHSAFPLELIREHAKLIVDTRGVFDVERGSGEDPAGPDRIVRS